MKIKKLIYIAGFTGTLACSLLVLDKIKFEKNVTKHSQTECNHDGNVVAHRGFSSLEVENSFNSVKTAADCVCVDSIEVDVRLTKDNELVLAHNSYVSGVGKISDKTLVELKKEKYTNFDVPKLQLMKSYIVNKDGKLIYDRYFSNKDSKEKITTLENVIDNIDSNKTLLVDMKFSKSNNDTFMDKVNEIFKEYEGSFDIILQANNYEELLKMKQKYPQYKYQLIIRKKKELKYLDSEFTMFGIRKNLITKDILDEQIEKGNTISVWTINYFYEYEELKDKLGESINDILIITDYPDEICYLNNKDKAKILK